MIVRPLRRWALLLVASALAAGPFAVVHAAPAAAAASDCTPCVHITFPDTREEPVDIGASVIDDNADVLGQQYEVRSTSGSTTELVTGLSLRKLLTTNLVPDPIDAASMTYVLIDNPNTGYESTLTAGDLDNPSPFVDQLEPAFSVAGNDSGIEYIRPLRNADDVNVKDRFQTGSITTTINVEVHTEGALLHPSVTVGPGQFHAHQSVPFAATFASGDPPHASAQFDWTYADGDPAVPGKRTTAHVYDDAGTYSAYVSVTSTDPGGGTDFGQSPNVIVQIGKARSQTGGGPPGGTGTGKKHHPKHGPDTGHGHHSGGHTHGGPTLGRTTAPTDSPVATPGASETVGATAGSTAHGPAPAPSAPVPPAATSSPTGAGEALVQGVLIRGSVAPAGGAAEKEATRAAAAARRPARPGSALDARWLWLLAPLGLLAAGAFGERRRPPHRHGRQSRL